MEKLRAGWRRETLHLGLAAMEACWLFPWLLMLTQGASNATQYIRFAALLTTLLLASYVTRLLSREFVPLKTQRALTLVIAVLSTLALVRVSVYEDYAIGNMSWLGQFGREVGNVLQHIPPSLIIFFAGLCLWWRGISLAQREFDTGAVGFSFRAGIVAFLWFFLATLFGSAIDATPFVLVYFFLGLIVMGLARVEGISHKRESIVTPFNLSWLGILTVSALVVWTIALMTMRLFSPRNVGVMLKHLHPALALLKRITYPLLLAMAWLLELILTAVIRLFGSVWANQDLEALNEYAEQLRLFQHIQPAQHPGVLSLILYVIQWGVIGLAVVGALGLLTLSINRRLRAFQAGRTGEHESAWEGENAGKEARNSLETRLRKLRESLQAQLARLRGVQYSLVSIRRIYASLGRLATAAGFPRRDAETPYEYAANLNKAFPNSQVEVVLITDAYVRTHYGERSFNPEYVQRVRDAWLTIRVRQEQPVES